MEVVCNSCISTCLMCLVDIDIYIIIIVCHFEEVL